MNDRSVKAEVEGKSWELAYTQRARKSLEDQGVGIDAFFSSLRTAKGLSTAILAGLEGARLREGKRDEAYTETDAEVLVDALGHFPAVDLASRAYQRGLGLPEAGPAAAAEPPAGAAGKE